MNRILIVDGELLTLLAMARTLEDDYSEVKTVLTGEAALAEIACRFYDLCFLDLDLRDHNGIDIMKRIKEISQETKVVIMTAGLVDGNVRKAIEEDAYHFIPKPFDLLQVRVLTKQALNGNHGHTESRTSGEKNRTERRRHARRPFHKIISYSMNTPVPEKSQLILKGEVVNISDGGMCIITDHPIETGSLLLFNGDSCHREGIVRWSRRVAENGAAYRAGILFKPF